MKKIVGIIAALALASSVFADPDATPAVVTFDGNASLEWIADLDAKTTGMNNGTSADFEIRFIAAGDKVTTGDQQLWGELKIKVGDDVKVKASNGEDADAFGFKGATVDTAKIHFMDDDFYLHLNILKPSLKFFGGNYAIATRSDAAPYSFVEGVVELGTPNGFTVEFGLQDLVAFNFQFADNGQQVSSAKKYAFVFDATLKGAGIGVDGLEVGAGAGYSTEKDAATGKDQDLVFVAKASYKLGIDDQFYVKPALQFTMIGSDNSALNAAVLFGWGDEGKQWRSDFLNFDNATKLNVASASYRTADGVSILLTKPIKEAGESSKYVALDIDAFDSKLLGDFGVTWGMGYSAWQDEVAGNKVGGLDKGALKFAAIYNTNVDIIYITARTTFGLDLAQKDDKFGIKYGLRVGTKELIANTDVYADYVGSYCKFAPCSAAAKDGLTKGIFKVGTKISF